MVFGGSTCVGVGVLVFRVLECKCSREYKYVQDMRHGIHSHGKILTEDSQGLLSHRTLVRITRTLIMIWEGNDRGAHSEYLF